ncbi:DUF3826 domain-containing protein [Anaerorudis cellulosivorans]|uniref:DUF3826 domain-containing protein n=1 Tax=Anaerorudis cellulosivorans TaxID=3397862 RepID=UPI00221FC949|nr:DUF3826 domain-containing protein [Seramator thermalis]MCW1735049.1 DUF3826 domain-containing protein [Seramator thermalis]
MKIVKLFVFFYVAFIFGSFATVVDLDSVNRNPAYVETIIARSQKIVDKLNLPDSEAVLSVRNIIANRYFELNDIYEKRDQALKALENNSMLSTEQKNVERERITNEKDAALYRTHFAFPANLSLFLTCEQIDMVKDGMTYGVLRVTYDAFLDMIPSLTEEEKKQIYAWLLEAREYAIDGESSSKKHEIFGKYKGRINNYLSKRGYNLTQERIEWEKRNKTGK